MGTETQKHEREKERETDRLTEEDATSIAGVEDGRWMHRQRIWEDY